MKATNVESEKVDTMLGEPVTLMEDLAPGGIGKAEFRGTGWNVHNLGQETLAKGERCRIEKVEGVNLWVRKE
jgi:membrane protein implicated in regulation of membrane protease activity